MSINATHRRNAADLMKKYKPENLGDFFECCEAEGYDDEVSSEMWSSHIRSLQSAGYRALAGLQPQETRPMTQTAPERIWAWPHTDGRGWYAGGCSYEVNLGCESDQQTEYVRADIANASRQGVTGLPRQHGQRLGWKLPPDLLLELQSEVTADGWDTCMEVVEIVALSTERRILALTHDHTEITGTTTNIPVNEAATYWAISSPTGVHIGLWDDERLARNVFKDCPDGSRLTPLRALAQEAE